MIEPEDDFVPPASMAELVEDVVADLAGVTRTTDTAATVLSRSDRPFAVLVDPVLEIRLDLVVATAALRTPDADASPRGSGWIRFAPTDLNRYAADRATAWLNYAWRHALD